MRIKTQQILYFLKYYCYLINLNQINFTTRFTLDSNAQKWFFSRAGSLTINMIGFILFSCRGKSTSDLFQQ